MDAAVSVISVRDHHTQPIRIATTHRAPVMRRVSTVLSDQRLPAGRHAAAMLAMHPVRPGTGIHAKSPEAPSQ